MELAVHKKQTGFTLPEVVIAMALAGALIAPLAIISVYFMSSMFDRSAEATLASQSQDILRTVSEDLRNANKILSSNSISDPNKSDGWTTVLNPGTLVFNSHARYSNSSRDVIYDGSGQMRLNEFVYFTQNGILYKRSLPFDGAGSNLTRRSCPAALTGSSCVADTELAKNLSLLTFTLFDIDNQITTNPTAAKSVLVKASLSTPSIGGSVNVEREIRVTLRKS